MPDHVSADPDSLPGRYHPRPVRAMVAAALGASPSGRPAGCEIRDDDSPPEVVLGNLCLNLDRFVVTIAAQRVVLTGQEFDLLAYLMVRKDRVVAFTTLMEWLWQMTGPAYERRLRSAMSRLRAKLSDASPYAITLVKGCGYKLCDPTALAELRLLP